MSGGIGAGLIIDGYPYRGATSNGLELGHISVDADGPRCDCGNRGCVDSVSRLVLAGNAFADDGPVYRKALQDEIDRSVFMRHVHSVRVELADDVSYAAAVDAAMVALRNLLKSPNVGDRPTLRAGQGRFASSSLMPSP